MKIRPTILILFLELKFLENEQNKGTFKIYKSEIAILVLNQCPLNAGLPIVRFAEDQIIRTNRGIPVLNN